MLSSRSTLEDLGAQGLHEEGRPEVHQHQESVRDMIVDGCEVALTALLYWQAVDGPRPVTTTVTGLVFAVRKAALLPVKRLRG
ncbi:MAG: hypothetical protein ACRDQZ_09600 [Mycobacteriales bacterium]